MILLIRLLSLLLLTTLAMPAAAAERVLLVPGGSTARAKAAAADSGALMRTATEQGKVTVIVGLRVPFAAEGALKSADAKAQRTDIARAASSFGTRMAAAIRRNPGAFRTYDSIPFAAIEVTPAELRALAADPQVISITQNGTYTTQLDTSIPMVRADQAWSAGFSGAGQTVAIIDTGVDKNHPFLAGKVVAEACFSEGGWCPGGATSSTAPGSGMPCPGACSHGTHVAGIAAGKGAVFSGVARDATIISIQGFSPSTYGGPTISWADSAAAADYVYSLRNTFSIASVNMSFGGFGNNPDDCDAQNLPMAAALANLRSVGIAPVVASGNDYALQNLSSPACLSAAVSVGAVATKDWGNCQNRAELGATARDKVACFSNSSPKLSLLAPGLYIESSVPGGDYAGYQGTSMAAPHVAGAWAVLKQKKPNASVDEILSVLQNKGVPVADYRNGRVTSRIDVKGALDLLGGDYRLLTYTKEGTGEGSVSFSPAAASANCAANCTNTYAPGTVVTLTATAAGGSEFTGWSGACGGTGSCTLTMSEARSVTATFKTLQFTLTYTKLGDGEGSITLYPAGGLSITCTRSCTYSFDSVTEIWVEPKPGAGSIFGEWTGECTEGNWCNFSVNKPITLTASFEKMNGSEVPLTFEMAGPGKGSALFSPPGTLFMCSENCVNSFRPGTQAVVVANWNDNSRFTHWTGACTGESNVCVVEMNEAKKIVANYRPALRPLSYVKAGTGSGTVSFSPAAEASSCKSSCNSNYELGTVVTLTAAPLIGSAFRGWSDACSGTGPCTVTVDKALLVTASFEKISGVKAPVRLQRLGSGFGNVQYNYPGGYGTCVPDCARSFETGTDITLTALAAPGSVFKGWTGDCAGTEPCKFSMESEMTVGATFEPEGTPMLPLTFTQSGTAQGSVKFRPSGGIFVCNDNCVNTYPKGTKVEVSVWIGPDTVFAGWTGACRGKGRCVVKMTKAAAVGAIFNRVPMYDLNYTNAGTGAGTVTFSTGPSCGASCKTTLRQGTRVTLRASANPGSIFTGWSGACRGKKTCTVTMNGIRSVTATFRLR